MTAFKVTARTPLDSRVTWGADMRPTAFPFSHGSLFMVKGAVAWVIWEGGSSTPQATARVALVRA
jgi:hypothetical protein